MLNRRLLPPAIAVVVIAIAGTVVWLANRSAPIPTTTPTSAPAAGSCWNVDDKAITGQLPWSASPVACTAPHTAEIVSVSQVDQKLVRTAQRAKGQDAQVNSFVMATSARAACLDKTGSYIGGAWRGAQLSVYPDFVAPAKDGFFACVVAQVADPGGQRVVARTASLAGALTGPGAASLAIDCVGDGPMPDATSGASSAATSGLSFVECGKSHTSEFVGLYTITPANAPYNGPEIQKVVTTGCQQLVNSILGLTSTDSRPDLRVSEVGPDSANLWAGSDQTFACYASASTPWVGSIKGVGTRPLQH
jgi:hypothetical protein